MYHNAFRQYVRWEGGMMNAPDDEAPAAAAHEPEEPPPKPPPEFWTYNEEQLALPPAATAYQKYCSDWAEWMNFEVPGGGDEIVPDGEEREWYDRMPNKTSWDNRTWYLLNNGIKVTTRVELSFLFGHENPLLVIRVDKQPGWTDSTWLAEKTSNTLLHRHVSIGPMKKIKSEINGWNDKLRQLYEKFHDRDLWLWGERVSSGGTLELSDAFDPIATDTIVKDFHTTLLKWNQQDDGTWLSNKSPLHISM